ncbi:MAG: ABC transporter permease [Terriglobales bacterium]
MKSLEFLRTIVQDVRYAVRVMAKAPGFTAVAVLTLALGIGANTAIFSLIDSVMLRALPVENPRELVVLQWNAKTDPNFQWYASYGDTPPERHEAGSGSSGYALPQPFVKEIEAANIFDGVAAYAGGGPMALSGNGPATMARGEFVNGDFFRTLGIHAAAGRLLGTADDNPSAAPAAVLSYAYWQQHFGGSHNAIGKVVDLNGVAFTIVGVTEPKFTSLTFGNVFDLWISNASIGQVRPAFARSSNDPAAWWLDTVARLKPGTTAAQAQAKVEVLFRNYVVHGDKPLLTAADAPAMALRGAHETLVGATTRFADPLKLLMASVGMVLLIACANVAGLVLSRATARRREIAVRLALGARRGRLVRQLLTESVVLALTGGAAGMVLAMWGAPTIAAMMQSSDREPLGFSPHIDWRVLAFTAAISLLTGVIFGLSPAWRSLRVDLTPALKGEAAGTSGAAPGPRRRWFALGNALVVLQAALAVVMLMGAGLLVHTLVNLKSVKPGFETRNILTFSLQPGLAGYKLPQSNNLYRQLKEEIGGLPGVQSVGYSESPLLSGAWWRTNFKYLPPGASKPEKARADEMNVGADFFSTLKIPLVTGRLLTDTDFAQAAARNLAHAAQDQATPGAPQPAALGIPLPVVVNQEFARKYFVGVNPLGRIFGQEDGSDPDRPEKDAGYLIVGVAGNVKYDSLRRSIDPTVYMPMAANQAAFEVRTSGDPKPLVPAIRSVIAKHDDNLPVTNVYTQSEYIDMAVGQERLVAELSGFFAALALLLACVGLYGLLSYEVSRQTREIGIRMALGSRASNLLWLVVSRGMALVLAGMAAGIAASLVLGRLMTSLLYGVEPADPASLIAAALLLSAVALAGAFVPARRATRIDPMVALRYE